MEDKELKPMDIIEDYKRRISDLIDEAADAIGYPIKTVEIEPPLAYIQDGEMVYRRKVTFNLKL